MTRLSRDFGNTMQKDAVPAVSADVVFASSRFPNYKIGANNQVVDSKDDPKVLSMKEVVARETAQLLEQQKRLSVRDLANKFEKGLAAAAKLSEEVVFLFRSLLICIPRPRIFLNCLRKYLPNYLFKLLYILVMEIYLNYDY